MYTTVFFDAAGTLMRPVRPVGESYALVAARYGMNVPPQEVSARFRACFGSAPPLAFAVVQGNGIKELELAWWKNLVQKVFEPFGSFPRFEDYFTDLFAYFARADSWRLFPETRDTLAALKHRGAKLAVISNFDSRLLGILDGLGVAAEFESIIISSAVGYAKPAPEIFQHALERHRTKAQQALHVGDSVEKDAEGARRAGIQGVLLDRNAKLKAAGFPKIKNLSELLPLIENGG
ncbi:MAG TPA: HAD-IA family hydrolase [Candidatus Binatia bacterium]|jgi:putative hydrolase of the HAD superfamily|nr:HAD-IA family hydrolase [Candidatus Binatia bacterium]